MSFGQWLYSKKNIAGCALAAVGAPALLLTGVVAPPLALALVPALYGIGALIAPSDKKESVTFTNALSKVEADDVEQSLAVIQESIQGNVGPEVGSRVTPANWGRPATKCGFSSALPRTTYRTR
jgi:hypothetical protein